MSQPIYTISSDEVLAEAIRMELQMIAEDRFCEFVCLKDAAKALAAEVIGKAKDHGIEAWATEVTWTRDKEGWTFGDPDHYEVRFGFPNEDHAVWFRTMVL